MVVAVIAIGGVVIAVDAATASTVVVKGGTLLSPNEPVLWLGVGMCCLGLVGVLLLGFTAFMRYREDRVTPFTVEFDPDDPNCQEWGYISTGPGKVVRSTLQLRVRVTNNGPIGLQRVRAFLSIPHTLGRSHFLHIQHDNEPTTRLSREGEHVPVGQPVYFDVAFAWVIAPPGHNFPGYNFSYADMAIATQSYRAFTNSYFPLDIRVSGWTDFRDVVPASRSFILEVKVPNTLALVQVQPQTSAKDG